MDDSFPEIPVDDTFTINISNSMELRNMLRAGLVQAQGKDTSKIPLFVSWPEWLEDGIVCLYARDFLKVLQNTVHETAQSFVNIIEEMDKTNDDDNNKKLQIPDNSGFSENDLSSDSEMSQTNS